MSHYIKSVLTASLLAAALLVSEPASPQTHVPVKQETILTFAHDLLQVFYPELFDKNHRVTLCVTAPGDDTLLETTRSWRRHLDRTIRRLFHRYLSERLSLVQANQP
jgi:hypothetical protein